MERGTDARLQVRPYSQCLRDLESKGAVDILFFFGVPFSFEQNTMAEEAETGLYLRSSNNGIDKIVEG